MSPTKRPTGVSLIAWSLVVTGALKLMLAPFAFAVPKVQKALEIYGMALNTAVLWQIVLGAILVISGVAILKGLSWGRLLYLGSGAISTVSVWLLYGSHSRERIGPGLPLLNGNGWREALDRINIGFL